MSTAESSHGKFSYDALSTYVARPALCSLVPEIYGVAPIDPQQN